MSKLQMQNANCNEQMQIAGTLPFRRESIPNSHQDFVIDISTNTPVGLGRFLNDLFNAV